MVAAGQPRLSVVHHHPGRLRVRTQAFLDEAPVAERTRVGIAGANGVRAVAVEPRTGSLLVQYAPGEIDAEALVARIAELSGLEVVAGRRRPNAVAPEIVRAFRGVDRVVQDVTGGRFDLGVVVPTGLAALGVYSFFKSGHRRLPRWDSLVYWAYSVFLDAHAEGRPGS